MVATSSGRSELGDLTSIGRVFDVSKGCVDDGPGLRTVVFLKGCHLDCLWCHNPEGKDRGPQIAFHSRLCISCSRCREACPRTSNAVSWREGCLSCGRCTTVCPSGAKRLVGETMEASELVTEVIADRDFFMGTGGGVTFSGGEPMVQPGFVFAVADELKRQGVHVAVETAGFWPRRLVPELSARVDLVIFDLKHVRPDRFQQNLGADYGVALENLERLIESRVELELRITLVPGFNDSDADLEALSDWLRPRARGVSLRLQAFHRMGAAKEDILGSAYPYASVAPLPRERLIEAVSALRADELDVEAA